MAKFWVTLEVETKEDTLHCGGCEAGEEWLDAKEWFFHNGEYILDNLFHQREDFVRVEVNDVEEA